MRISQTSLDTKLLLGFVWGMKASWKLAIMDAQGKWSSEQDAGTKPEWFKLTHEMSYVSKLYKNPNTCVWINNYLSNMPKCNCKWEPSWNLNVFHCGFRGIRTNDRYPVFLLVIQEWCRSSTDKIKISTEAIMIGKSQGKFYAAQHTEPTQNNFVLLHWKANSYI